ncbi:MAG TPA: hypothetical protein VK654_09615 [Nitrospirota bacterium]|nr:hypothetical protein [Nitrospirota bacterium]
MKNSIEKTSAYIGAGFGLAAFAVFGLLPGSLLGGAAGIKAAGLLLGLPLEPGIISRTIVLISMLIGIVASGTVFVTAASAAGWLIGKAFRGASSRETASAHNHS